MDTVQIQYRIADLKEKRFFIQEAPNLDASTIRSTTTFIVNNDISLDALSGHIIIQFDFRLVPRNNHNTTFLHYVASLNYEIGGFELMVEGTENPSIPTQVMEALIAASYSTFRGSIYSRCGASILRHAILPMSDPSMFLKNTPIIKAPLVATGPITEE